jgi:dipeptidyl aminopeptidase/acylaminoacyl peptidase
MKRFGLGCVAILCGLVWAGLGADVAAGQGAAAKRPMTFADLMAMKRVSDPQISPSGKWVMFSVTDVSLEKNTKVNHLWVVSMAGGAERQITFADGESNGRFSPDGKWISLTLKDQIAVTPWNDAQGTIGFDVASYLRITNIPGGADGAIWSPDSKRLLFTAQVYPECSVQGGDAALKQIEPSDGKAIVGGSLALFAWKNLEPATWADEDACDKAKDAAADKTPVKGQVWDGLLYRHWDHYTGQKRTHILAVDADGQNVRDLTPASAVGDAETPTFSLGGTQDYAWAPDSKEIAYVTNLDPVPAASTNNDVFTLRLDEPGAKAVKVSTSPGSDDEPEYSPDGKYLAFRSQARNGFESDRFRLMFVARVIVSAGQQARGREWSEPGELMPKFDNWVDEFAWTPDSAAIVFTSGEHGTESVISCNIPIPGGLSQGGPTVWLAGGEYSDIRVVERSARKGGVRITDDWVVADLMSVSAPTEVVTFNAGMLGHSFYDENVATLPGYLDPMETGELVEPGPESIDGKRALTHLNDPALARLALSSLGYFWFTGADGTKVEGFLLKPPGFDPAKKYPVKFLLHGGPQTAWGDAWSFRWNFELMAASGYVVIGINRRGSTGYGQKFVDEVSGDWGGRAYEDLMKGLDYAEAHYSFIDKTRECALGGSYGGYMANWILTHTNRFKCIVTHDGLYDPASAYGDTEEMWFNEWEFRTPADYPKGWDGFPPDPKQSAAGHPAEPWRYQNLPADQDPFRKWSPMRFIQNAKTPTLVIHSQKDYRLDVSQGMELFTALQRLGVPSKFLYFPDEGHWVLKPQNSQLWNEVVGDWCDRWTHTNAYAETK